FGDSTWDNLGLRGHSAYVTCLYAGMAAVLGDDRLRAAARDILDELWDGDCFRAASEGKYADAVMGDSVLGLFYADVCGAGDVVPRERVVTHLRTAYERTFTAYADGSVGPLLVASGTRRRYDRDGGEELQVNEVLLGSAWTYTAMLAHYGLRTEATAVAKALRDTLYGGTGLQFRTPAA